MALSIDKIKQEFTRNKKRAVILGVLVVIMVAFVVKAYFDMSPRSVDASDIVATPANPAEAPASAADSDARIKQSKELWSALRQTRGIPPALAFSFIPTYYPHDPNSRHVTPEPETSFVTPQVPTAPVTSQQAERSVRIERIKAEARQKLTVTSTVVGSGNSRPVAVISGRIVGVGDLIFGFEVISIKAREVEFKKEGETFAMEMAKSARPAEEKRD